MKNNDYLKKVYRKFSKFIEIATIREQEYFILDAKYTNEFNIKVKELIKEIESEGKNDVEISVLFDTKGDIVLIDGEIIGKYIANCYNYSISTYYKEDSLNRIIREVINGSDKAQVDFIRVSYAVIYNIMGGLYKEIKCKKEILKQYKNKFGFYDYQYEDDVLVVLSLLILEDISKYITINPEAFLSCIQHIKDKKNVTN
ncbi:MAG: hypothetical protein H7Y18_08115 [Clostridiaceae bacterium]|nr:hypothetical protein [Clostridiaceae bacterium]